MPSEHKAPFAVGEELIEAMEEAVAYMRGDPGKTVTHAGSRFDDFLDEFGERNEVYASAIEFLKRDATPQQLEGLRKLLHRNPPWEKE